MAYRFFETFGRSVNIHGATAP
eukprot:COSAG05_NODE_26793_length_181_cov_15.621951_1_plen_21_part_10